MTEKEFKRLSRMDLLEMLISQGALLEEAQAKLQDAEAALAERRIDIENAGTMAEAALKLNGVFEAAQKAAEQYEENLKLKTEEADRKTAEMIQRAEMEALRIQEEARAKADTILRMADYKAYEMVEKARVESKFYWKEITSRLDTLAASDAQLAAILKNVKNGRS